MMDEDGTALVPDSSEQLRRLVYNFGKVYERGELKINVSEIR